MDRRDFLKIAAMTATGALIGAGNPILRASEVLTSGTEASLGMGYRQYSLVQI